MAKKARVVSFDRPALGFSPPPRDGNVGLGSGAADSRKALPGAVLLALLPPLGGVGRGRRVLPDYLMPWPPLVSLFASPLLPVAAPPASALLPAWHACW